MHRLVLTAFAIAVFSIAPSHAMSGVSKFLCTQLFLVVLMRFVDLWDSVPVFTAISHVCRGDLHLAERTAETIAARSPLFLSGGNRMHNVNYESCC